MEDHWDNLLQPRDINSLQQTANMGSHGETVKPDKKICDKLSRLRTRSRLREIANKRCQASNNNNGEHPLLDQDNFIHDRGTLTTTILETHPPEMKQTNATNDTYEPTATEKATIKGNVSRDVDGRGPDPKDRNGNSSDNNCRGGESNLSTLGWRQLDEGNPTFCELSGSTTYLYLPHKRIDPLAHPQYQIRITQPRINMGTKYQRI